MRVVKTFGRLELEEARLGDVRRATVEAALKARRVESLLAPVVTVVVSLCTALAACLGALGVMVVQILGQREHAHAVWLSSRPNSRFGTEMRGRDAKAPGW